MSLDGENFIRKRLDDCRKAADASPLPNVRDKHLSATRTWQALLTMTLERKASDAKRMQGVSIDTADVVAEPPTSNDQIEQP